MRVVLENKQKLKKTIDIINKANDLQDYQAISSPGIGRSPFFLTWYLWISDAEGSGLNFIAQFLQYLESQSGSS